MKKLRSLKSPGSTARARMVDVGGKPETARAATAVGRVYMRPGTLRRIRRRDFEKGDVLAVAETAGVMAAKRTPDLIPLCHPIPLTGVELRFDLDRDSDGGERPGIEISATVKTTGRTGAEMEAMTAVCAAALTIYDMCKSADREMSFGEIMLTAKSGGKSGTFRRLSRGGPSGR